LTAAGVLAVGFYEIIDCIDDAFFAPSEPVPRALLIKSAGIEAAERLAAEDG
jgi:hypothetical protein